MELVKGLVPGVYAPDNETAVPAQTVTVFNVPATAVGDELAVTVAGC
jgi:hypothetical protein